MNPFTWIFQISCLDFQWFAVVFKTFQNMYFTEHLSMDASDCVETGIAWKVSKYGVISGLYSGFNREK